MKVLIKLIRTSTVPVSLNILLRGQLEFLNEYYKVIAVSGAGKDLTEVKERENVDVYSIPMQRNISLFKDWKSFFKLYLFFRKTKPEIVHSITPKAGLLSMAAAYFARVPIRIHTFTGLVFPSKDGPFQKLLIWMDRMLCFFATNIYPEGKGVKNDLLNYKITKKPLKVLANGNVNGIDTSYFNPNLFSDSLKISLRDSINISSKDFVYVFVGRLVGDKGLNELIGAFNSLACDNIKLILVGPYEHALDPLKSLTLQIVESNQNIISVGYQIDVRPYLAISNCLVFPSYREGFPNVVLQAGSMGLPSIVTNINGSNEIIIDGINGVIIPPKNEIALLKAMKEIKTEEELVLSLQANARKMVVDRYEQQKVWDALLAEYKSLESLLNRN